MAYYSAVTDTTSSIILTLSTQVAIIEWLAKSHPELETVYGINWPRWRGKKFWLETAKPSTYPEWSWEPYTRQITPTNKPLLTDEVYKRSALLTRKGHAAWEFTVELTGMRYAVWKGLLLQETVYRLKEAQARKFKETGCPDDAVSYPFVFQYADLVGLTPEEASDEILFKAHLCEEKLTSSELVRLKYFNLLKGAADIPGVEAVVKEFRDEMFRLVR